MKYYHESQSWEKAHVEKRRQTSGKEAKALASGFTQWANPEQSQESK